MKSQTIVKSLIERHKRRSYLCGSLEKFFATKWPAEKRFGLEGGESMIVMLEEIVDTGTKLGIESIIMAMQHRGEERSHRTTLLRVPYVVIRTYCRS